MGMTTAQGVNGATPPDLPISVTLEAREWNTVIAGLYELPAKFSYQVIQRLQSQLQSQSQQESLPRGQLSKGPRSYAGPDGA